MQALMLTWLHYKMIPKNETIPAQGKNNENKTIISLYLYKHVIIHVCGNNKRQCVFLSVLFLDTNIYQVITCHPDFLKK